VVKKFIWCLVLIAALFLPALVQAVPYLVCDIQTDVQYYQVTGAPWVTGNIPVQVGWIRTSDGKLFLTDPGGATTKVHVISDVAQAVVGTTNIEVKACRVAAWGEVCSVSAPFALVRPSGPAAPPGLKLVQ
jgi:hypothetical protein